MVSLLELVSYFISTARFSNVKQLVKEWMATGQV